MWDKTNTLDPTLAMNRFASINSKEGFLIKANAPMSMTFPIDETKNDPDGFTTFYGTGWYLVRVNVDKTAEEINTLVEAQGYALKYIYKLENGQWELNTPDTLLDSQIDSTITRIEGKISRFKGFWVYVEK